jgi:hypothetical protein
MAEREWEIIEGPTEISPSDVDVTLFRFRVKREDEERTIIVAIANTLMASVRETLTTPLDYIVATKGRAAVEDALSRGTTPERITVNSSGTWS